MQAVRSKGWKKGETKVEIQGVKAKIEKLRSLAKNTPYISEKETANAMADRLAHKYNLSEGDFRKENTSTATNRGNNGNGYVNIYSFGIEVRPGLFPEHISEKKALEWAARHAKNFNKVMHVYAITRRFRGVNPLRVDPFYALFPNYLTGEESIERKLWCDVMPDGTVHYCSQL